MERPETLLTLSDYAEDIAIRWQIHLYEWNKLAEDIQKTYSFLLPFFVKYKNNIVTAYKREFGSTK